MRLRNDPLAWEKLEKSGMMIASFPFTIEGDTILEFGMGKGEMLTELARQNPKKNYIGIERYATVAAKAVKRAISFELENFKVICEDIIDLSSLLSGSVKEIWLTFSDPWPKARHEKRRLTYKGFLDIYKNVLSKDGVIKFKTDNDKLFEYSLKSFKDAGWKLSNVTRDFHSHDASKGNVMTGYEEKWSSQNKNINYLEARL